MSSERWLTHVAAAEHLGLTIGSLRNRARTEGWEKGTDSQGEPTFLVPADAAAKGQRARSIKVAKSDQAEPSPDLVALQHRIAELEADLTTARGERDQERAERQQERERADQATSETAEVALRMAGTVDESRTMAKADRRRAEAAEAELVAAKHMHEKEIEKLRVMLARMLEVHDFVQMPLWKQVITPKPPSAIGFDTMVFRAEWSPSR